MPCRGSFTRLCVALGLWQPLVGRGAHHGLPLGRRRQPHRASGAESADRRAGVARTARSRRRARRHDQRSQAAGALRRRADQEQRGGSGDQSAGWAAQAAGHDAGRADNPVYLATDKQGRYLLTAYYGAAKAAIYPIKSDGTIGSEATSLVHDRQESALDSGRSAAIALSSCPTRAPTRCCSSSSMPATGKITPNSPAELATGTGTGPRHFWFHPKGNFVYFVNEKGKQRHRLPVGYAERNALRLPDHPHAADRLRGQQHMCSHRDDARRQVSVRLQSRARQPRLLLGRCRERQAHLAGPPVHRENAAGIRHRLQRPLPARRRARLGSTGHLPHRRRWPTTAARGDARSARVPPGCRS